MLLINLMVNLLYRKYGVPLHNFFENWTRGISYLKTTGVLNKTLRLEIYNMCFFFLSVYNLTNFSASEVLDNHTSVLTSLEIETSDDELDL